MMEMIINLIYYQNWKYFKSKLLPQLEFMQILIQSVHYVSISVVKITPIAIVYQILKRRIMQEIVKIHILTLTHIIHGGMIIQVITRVEINFKILTNKLLKIPTQDITHSRRQYEPIHQVYSKQLGNSIESSKLNWVII